MFPASHAQFELMVRKACFRGDKPICSITPFDRRYMFQTRKGCWSLLYGGKLPLNFSCHGTSVTPTFPTVASGAAAILPVAASAATCWRLPMLIIEVSLSGRPQLGL